jgi:hypothetical protein
MVYRGHVEDGIIQLEGAIVLPEGAEVRVEMVAPPAADTPGGATPRSLYERLKPLIGAAKDLPADASVNVDHYLYGHPKQ